MFLVLVNLVVWLLRYVGLLVKNEKIDFLLPRPNKFRCSYLFIVGRNVWTSQKFNITNINHLSLIRNLFSFYLVLGNPKGRNSALFIGATIGDVLAFLYIKFQERDRAAWDSND